MLKGTRGWLGTYLPSEGLDKSALVAEADIWINHTLVLELQILGSYHCAFVQL